MNSKELMEARAIKMEILSWWRDNKWNPSKLDSMSLETLRGIRDRMYLEKRKQQGRSQQTIRLKIFGMVIL